MVLFSIWDLTSIYWRSCRPLLHMGSNVYLLEVLWSSSPYGI